MMTADERNRWDDLDPARRELTANLYDMRAVLRTIERGDEFYTRAREWLDSINPTIRYIEENPPRKGDEHE